MMRSEITKSQMIEVLEELDYDEQELWNLSWRQLLLIIKEENECLEEIRKLKEVIKKNFLT